MNSSKLKFGIWLAVLLLIVVANLLPAVSLADPLVPCGTGNNGPQDCTLYKLVTLANNVINFLLYEIALPVSIILIIYAGGRIVVYRDNPGERSKALGLLKNVLIGFAIMFGAFIIVKAVLDFFANPTSPLGTAMGIVFGTITH